MATSYHSDTDVDVEEVDDQEKEIPLNSRRRHDCTDQHVDVVFTEKRESRWSIFLGFMKSIVEMLLAVICSGILAGIAAVPCTPMVMEAARHLGLIDFWPYTWACFSSWFGHHSTTMNFWTAVTFSSLWAAIFIIAHYSGRSPR